MARNDTGQLQDPTETVLLKNALATVSPVIVDESTYVSHAHAHARADQSLAVDLSSFAPFSPFSPFSPNSPNSPSASQSLLAAQALQDAVLHAPELPRGSCDTLEAPLTAQTTHSSRASVDSDASDDELFLNPSDDDEDEGDEEDYASDDDVPTPELFRNADGSYGVEQLAGLRGRDLQRAVHWTSFDAPPALLDFSAAEFLEAPAMLRGLMQAAVDTVSAVAPGLQASVTGIREERRAQKQRQRDAIQAEEAAIEARERDEAERARRRAAKGKMRATLPLGDTGTSDTASDTDMAASVATLRAMPMSATSETTARPTRKRNVFAKLARRFRGEGSGMGVTGHVTAITSTSIDNNRRPGTADSSESSRRRRLVAKLKPEPDPELAQATVECTSCFEDVPAKRAVHTTCHAYCLDCFTLLVATAVDNEAQFPPKCCLNTIPSATVLKYVTRDVARRYTAKTDEVAVPVADRFYCPVVDCGVFVPPRHIAAAARTARCTRGHESCTACRAPVHGRNNREACPQMSAADTRDRQLAEDLAAEEGWRRCASCDVLVEHTDACQHMTCRCGAQFCYVCGLRWPTCSCTMHDLQTVKDRARLRVEQRQQREAIDQARRDEQAALADRELADVREALRLVAELERLENERLAAERAAQRVRLQALVDARLAVLRTDTETKFDGLRRLLACLSGLQKRQAQATRRADRADLRASHARDRDALLQKHAAEMAAESVRAESTIRAAERHWDDDYRARLALERTLEHTYRTQLVALNPTLSAADVEQHMRKYQRENDARLDDYRAWRDRDLESVRYAATDTRDIHAEVCASRARRQAAQRRADVALLRRRHNAERVWCALVEAERERLLDSAHDNEVALGLAASSSDIDATLLMLVEMDQADDGLYSVLLDGMIQQMGVANVRSA